VATNAGATVHARAEIEAELAWMQAVRHETSVLCPSPIPRRDGCFVTGLSVAHRQLREFVRCYESADDRIGLIHGDLHLLNLMVHGTSCGPLTSTTVG
jgi:Ser/Thr protein kinase RdoA (MazF antagonist)